MQKTLTREDGIATVYGGGVLGGGGGGHIETGLAQVQEVFADGADLELVTPDEISPMATAACVALVGAPSAEDTSVSADQLIGTVRDLQSSTGVELAALMTNENGPGTSINGWLQASALGLPILDAPANGRAHPTGIMGSLGLHKEVDYQSTQAFAGGAGDRSLSGVVRGGLNTAAQAVRDLSVLAGGMVGVCRNPVSIARVREHAAIGAISRAIEVGRAHLDGSTGSDKIGNVVDLLGGKVQVQDTVRSVDLRQEGGFDVGEIHIGTAELTFWNEYMTLEISGKRLSTFPDLIMTLDTETGLPIVSAGVEAGQDLTVITVSRDQLILGSSMFDLDLLRGIEPIVKKPIVS